MSQVNVTINGRQFRMFHRETDAAKRHAFAWQSFCKAMLSTNEFIYVN